MKRSTIRARLETLLELERIVERSRAKRAADMRENLLDSIRTKIDGCEGQLKRMAKPCPPEAWRDVL